MQLLIDSITELAFESVGYEIGSTGFSIVAVTCFVVSLVALRLLSSAFGSGKGTLSCGLAIIFPVVLSLVAYGAVEVYALPELTGKVPNWLPGVLPLSGLGLVLFLGVMFISSAMLDMDKLAAVLVFLVASCVGLGSAYGAKLILGMAETSQEQREDREKRMDRGFGEIEGL